MPPIEGATELIRDIGAEELAEYISKRTGANVRGGLVQEAFKPPTVEQVVGEVEILGLPRQVLAIVTHELKVIDPEKYRMMDWIPEVRQNPGYRNSEAQKILKAFGIAHLENFTRGNLLFPQRAPTKMYFSGIGGEWIFEKGYLHFSDTFGRLKKTLWAIAMLPKPVLEEALKKRHFLLVSEQIKDPSYVGEPKPTIASITKGLREVLVEDFSYNIGDYKKGQIETDTPVVVFHYY